MPVPTVITDLSQTAASNYPAGSDAPSSLDDVQRAHASFIALIRDGKGLSDPVTLASGTTTDIGGQNSLAVEITGTTTITGLGTNYNGPRFLRFTGILVLTHSATLSLPGAANITTAAGDTCIALPNSGGTGWNVPHFQRAASLTNGAAEEMVNAQTGTTYTYLTGDKGKLVTHSNASAIAGTLPQAGATFPDGWWVDVQNRGAGTLTITPTTSTVDGAATLVLVAGQGARIVSDGTNYFTQRGVGVVPDASITAPKLSGAQTGSAPIYGCRAWVNFDGTGTAAIRASGNVSSITDNAPGDYKVNFTTAMPDANYAVVCSAHATTFLAQSNAAPNYSTFTTGSVDILTGNTVSGALTDMSHISVAIFR